MRIIAVIAQKGGTGKTTLSTNLSACGVASGKTTVLIDLDSQPTSTLWGDRRNEHFDGRDALQVVSTQVARLPQVLTVCQQNGAGFVVLDTPPRTDSATLAACKAAELVLIAVRPAINDIETLTAVKDLLGLAGNPRAAVVINAAPVRGSRHLQCERFCESLGLACAPVVLRHRQAYADAPNRGLGVCEHEPSGEASAEMQRLFRWVQDGV